jgi:hypothetical protein
MPVVTIKSGDTAADGSEEVLRQYLCDYPGCPNPAYHVMGQAREIGGVFAVCDEHSRRGHAKAV